MFILFVAVVIATIVQLLPINHNALLTTSEAIMRKMPPFHYEELVDFLTGADEKSFYDASDGVHGLFLRLWVAYLCLRLVQAHWRARRIGKEDAWFVWKSVFGQAFFSGLALPVVPYSHRMAIKALGYYCKVIERTCSSCYDDAEHPLECLSVLPCLY